MLEEVIATMRSGDPFEIGIKAIEVTCYEISNSFLILNRDTASNFYAVILIK